MKHLKVLTVFPNVHLIQMRRELLCKINTATNKPHEKYLIINTTYINKLGAWGGVVVKALRY
jgi:hypothetical protein